MWLKLDKIPKNKWILVYLPWINKPVLGIYREGKYKNGKPIKNLGWTFQLFGEMPFYYGDIPTNAPSAWMPIPIEEPIFLDGKIANQKTMAEIIRESLEIKGYIKTNNHGAGVDLIDVERNVSKL